MGPQVVGVGGSVGNGRLLYLLRSCTKDLMEHVHRGEHIRSRDLDVPGGYAMKANAGDRYRCSDASCGCQVEIRNPSRLQADGGSTAAQSGRSGATGISGRSSGTGSLRSAESQSTSTQGAYGSQEGTGEGTFGTSGGSSGMMQGRYGSDSTAGSSGSTPSSTPSSRTMEDSPAGPFPQHSGSGTLFCFCGKPMHRAGQGESQSSSRTAEA
jgi:hypothetical protein